MKNTIMSKATQGALALSATLALFSGQAAAEFQDFTIDEGSVPGAIANLVNGDKLNGGYTEVLTILPGIPLTFTTQAYATFGQVFADEGTPPNEPNQIDNLGANGYALYALFSAAGTFSGGTFSGTSGSFELFIDPDQDTGWTLTDGNTPVAVSNGGDDYKIASATNPVSLVGLAGNPGAFDFVWNDFTLTAAGENYFIAPNPFYLSITVDGDFDEFPVAPGDIDLTGDVSAVFVVPAPGSIALLGLGLAGLGLRLGRKKA